MKTYNVGPPPPATDHDNKYTLVILDYFMKWTESYAMLNQEAVTVANVAVCEFISRFGVLRQLHTDQGPNFENQKDWDLYLLPLMMAYIGPLCTSLLASH